MKNLQSEISIMVPGYGYHSVARLEFDSALIGNLNKSDLDAAVSITDDITNIMIEDSLHGMMSFFTTKLPKALKNGKGDSYSFRFSHEKLSVTLEGDNVTIDHDGHTSLRLAITDLQAVIEDITDQYNRLESILP